ncbi:MAG: class A beta-lactamase-related serine hydrolase [Chitinophagia bacterium]|nr:class A beta-lactamase-related serine hydrolase [Chitinophagia bacterium]
MFIRFTLLLGFFFLSIACGTGQGPRFLDITSKTILSNDEKERLIAEVKAKYETLLGNTGFSGEILIAKNGEVIFEDYKGYSNFSDKTAILPETPIHLASISKTFTGMAALKLWEDERLDLKAPVTKYIANFPYTNVTIEQLLSHRSGLPDYTYFMESNKYKTVKVKNKRGRWVKKLKLIKAENPFRQGFYNNQDVLDYMVSKRPVPAAMPNRVFKYCNTNYVVLALIIEKITGQDFPTYMAETIFKPLKMENTYVFSAKSVEKYIPSYNARMVPYKIEKYDCIYGDKNIYSTVRDMYLWDKALSEGTYLKPSTLEMAYQPQSPINKYYHNYGLGWRILAKPNEERLVYHNGWWHGNNTVFTRLINESATIIILGNKFNKSIYKGKEIASVFTGKVDTSALVE